MVTGERERRGWWACFEGNVVRVTGYACGPDYPDMWWCQQVGHTLHEGSELFAGEAEALRVAIREADRAQAAAQARRAIFAERLADLG